MNRKTSGPSAGEWAMPVLLVLCGALFGLYKIAGTVVISRDAIWYIERAQVFANDPIVILRSHPFGFPAMICYTHAFARLFVSDSPVLWAISAQLVSVGCFLLTLLAVFGLARMLSGTANAVGGVLVLLLLPAFWEDALNGLRDWPAMVFLASGLLLLVYSRQRGGAVLALTAGLVTGAGMLIRPECSQLVLLGLIWWGRRIAWPDGPQMRRKGLVFAAFLMLGCLITAGPYAAIKYGLPVHPPADDLISAAAVSDGSGVWQAAAFGGVTGSIAWKGWEYVFENLAWYFAPFWLIGGYYYLRDEARRRDGGLILLFVMFQVALFLGRYWFYSSLTSSRYFLAMQAMTIFWVPMGMEQAAIWFSRDACRDGKCGRRLSRSMFAMLLIPGVVIFSAKLFRPVGYDKLGYRRTAEWLASNTPQDALIAVPDRRLYFYADRVRLPYMRGELDRISRDADYFVDASGMEEAELEDRLNRGLELLFETPADPRQPRERSIRVFRIAKKNV